MPPKARVGRRAAGTANVDTGSQKAPIDITADTASVVSSEAASTTAPGQTDRSDAASTATTAASKPPVQRVGSLKNSPAASASQSTRGKASARGRKPVTRQPAGKGRRNKEEREALEKEALEKERARKAEADAEERKQTRGSLRGDSRGRGDRPGRGRGGFMGSSDLGISGPFSTGRHDKTTIRKVVPGVTGSRAFVVKTEPNMRPDDDHYRGASGSGIKKEGGGYVSSEEEQDDEEDRLPKLDIDTIDLTQRRSQSPENEEPKQHIDIKKGLLLPVRIIRREHQERVVGINTEASSSSARKLKEEPGKDTDASSQGKMKGKDFEITEVRRPYRGMWKDPPEDDVPIKPEPREDVDELNAVPQAPQELDASSSTKEPQASPAVGKKPKKQPSRGSVQKPALQTEQEKQEWDRYQQSLQMMKYELGSKRRPPKVEVRDESGDVVMKEGEAAEDNKNDPALLRDQHVYLFQLPPILPDLLPPEVKSEPTGEENTPGVDANNGEETVIKLEEGPSAAPEPRRTGPRLTSGRIGKMRVHASGRTTLDWGGMMFEVKRGLPAQFLQETVCTRITPEQDRVNEDDGGTAISFGPVKGNFVVTPDWSELLG